MWEAVQIALTILFAAGLTWLRLESDTYVRMPRRDRQQDWKGAVARCGLQIAGLPTTAWGHPKLTARSGAVEVRIETSGKKGEDTRIVVEAPVALDFDSVKIHPQAGPRAGDVEVGDPRFDNAFSIAGQTLQLFALLDDGTRKHFCSVSGAGRLEVSRDGIVAVVSPEAWVSDVLPSLLAIATRLGKPAVLLRNLVENVKRDSESGVRLQNLLLLLRHFPGDPATVEALRAACSDRSSAIRLRAARELGAEGRDTLLQVAYSLDDDALSAEAVSILDRDLPFERAKAILYRAWSSGRHQTARVCVQALGHQGNKAVAPLAEVLAGLNVELAAAAARALVATRSPAAEPVLIQALRHEEADIRLAATIALGHIGSAAAVLPLKEAAESSRLDFGLSTAARQAIAEIQSRAEGASPGQLSLAGEEAGQLSLADDPAGRLSLPPREDPA